MLVLIDDSDDDDDDGEDDQEVIPHSGTQAQSGSVASPWSRGVKSTSWCSSPSCSPPCTCSRGEERDRAC